MSDQNEQILIVAGEASGDLHASALIEEIKKTRSDLNFYGIGGDKMKTAGLEVIYHINDLAFLGFTEVIKHLPFISKVKKEVIKQTIQRKTKLAILVDYPGFNLNIAHKLAEQKIKVIYYISPQIWAWGRRRIHKIRRCVSKMIVFFPFEHQLYTNEGVDTVLAGHPLVERIKHYSFLSKEELIAKYNLNYNKDILIILPGSRVNEITKILPSAILAAKRLSDKYNLQTVIACSDNIDEGIIQKLNHFNFTIAKSNTYDFLKYSKVGIIKSGTSTLEAGILGLPMVIVYVTSYLTYFIGRLLVKVKNIGLINITAGSTIVPELIQDKVNEKNIFNKLKAFLEDDKLYLQTKEKLINASLLLGEEGATRKAAATIILEIDALR